LKPYYQDEAVTIYHGDCREVLPCLEKVDLVLTDPPYAHGHMDGGGFASARRFYAEGALDGLNDFDLSVYSDLLLKAAPMLIAFHSRDLVPDYAALSRSVNRKFDLHVWHKTNAIPFTANTWKSDIEYISLIWESKRWAQREQHLHSKVYQSPINADDSHPAAKPLRLLKKYIDILDARSVIDPFMGSGTTLRAAKDLNRKAIGIEIEEKYCEIAAQRMAQQVLEFA
jgi:site-specific DNA-methyltransferase (adenine-specific)